MQKLKKKDEMPILVKVESREEFFARGKRNAKFLDQNKIGLSKKIISFEDPSDLVKFLSESKLTLIAIIRRKPDSVTKLARKLHRSRASVDKDVQLLESVGIVKSEYVVNPGHGKCKIVKASGKEPIKLYVEATI